MIKLIFEKINFSKSCKGQRHFFKWNYIIFLYNMIPPLILHIKVLR